jgi:DNA replication protein DnaC
MAQALKELLDRVAPNLEKITQQNFDGVELSEAEIQEALRKAREKKHYEQKRAEYFEKLDKRPEVKLYTSQELKVILKAAKNPQGKPFLLDKDNQGIATLLCQYFSNDPEFEKEDRKLTKGLCLMGNLGVGKTFLMGFFHQNQNQSYIMLNCRKLEGLWIDQMSAKDKPLRNVIDQHSTAIQASVNSNPFGHQALGACFDDLGTETSPSKSYGEEKNVLSEILMNRYESGLPFNYTHITTNLSAHDIGIKYGTRVKDRFREMFNQIQFNNDAKSRR